MQFVKLNTAPLMVDPPWDSVASAAERNGAPFWTPFSLFVTKKSDGERSAAGDGVSSGQGDPKSAMSQCQKIVAKNAPLRVVCSVFIRFSLRHPSLLVSLINAFTNTRTEG
jgi:hypothetical protein